MRSMYKPWRAYYRQAAQDASKSPPTALLLLPAAKAACFCDFVFLLTANWSGFSLKLFCYTSASSCKWFDIFLYRFLLRSAVILVISSAPIMSVSVFVLEVGMPIKYHQTAPLLTIPYTVLHLFAAASLSLPACEGNQGAFRLQNCFPLHSYPLSVRPISAFIFHTLPACDILAQILLLCDSGISAWNVFNFVCH